MKLREHFAGAQADRASLIASSSLDWIQPISIGDDVLQWKANITTDDVSLAL